MSWLYSQALVAEFSAAKCSAGEPCAPLNSTPTPLGYCLPDKMTAVSKLSRYGMTFAPSTADHGAALLTWFRAAFPARISPAPAKARASMVNDQDYGLNSLASLARYDPDTCMWKTPQFSLLGDSIEFLETWPRWGLMRDGVCWQQPTLAHLTGESGSGLWATPTTMDTLPPKSTEALTREATQARPGRSKPGNLRDQTSSTMAWQTITKKPVIGFDLWRTPDANLASGGASNAVVRKEQGHAVGLADQVNTPECWPTPTKSDCAGGPGNSGRCGGDNLRTAVTYHTPRANDANKGGNLADDPRNGLPAQVQHLDMNWPTPASSDATRAGTITDNMTGQSLPQAIKKNNWPTPKALDAEKGPSQTELLRNSPTLAAMVAVVPTPSANDEIVLHPFDQFTPDDEADHPDVGLLPGGGQLNPDWVEWLMGWFVGWTNPAPLASTAILPWAHEPAEVPRVGHQIPARARRLKCIGNGQVPLCAAVAFLLLTSQERDPCHE